MKYEFDSEITRLEGKIKWSVFYFPYEAEKIFGTNGKIPVVITADGHFFEHTLLPSKKGHYLVYNEFIRRAVGKDLGDTIHVTLEKDTKERTYTPPPYIAEALKTAGVLPLYIQQPDYLQREQANFVEVAKKDETKQNRIAKLVSILRKLE